MHDQMFHMVSLFPQSVAAGFPGDSSSGFSSQLHSLLSQHQESSVNKKEPGLACSNETLEVLL